MMNYKDSIFELCKEVYEKFSEWIDTDNVWSPQPTGTLEEQLAKEHIGGFEHEYVPTKCLRMGQEVLAPYYTSDYLLEKLPHSIDTDGERNRTLNVTPTATGWFIGYFDQITRQFTYGLAADTPLKALLKLVLALHEAGELK